ncbi:MAG: bifunctional phosphoglucose/phosphomannose isomerase, partial [Dehalococcoidia bacterium]
MVDLDDHEVYGRLDTADMRGRIRELPQQCLSAWQQAQALQLPADFSKVDKVVILGMGGSAIG